jgi:hypothetical protein
MKVSHRLTASGPSAWIAQLLGRLRYGGERALRRTVPAPVAMLDLLNAGWLAQAIVAAAEIGLADAVGEVPQTAHEIAARLSINPDGCARLLRALAAHGIFAQHADGRYTLGALARTLRTDSADSLRDYALFVGSAAHREHWSSLARSIALGASSLPHLRGVGFFEYAQKDERLGALFGRAMSNLSALSRDFVLDAYDFSRFGSLVDVGGGEGVFLSAILARVPELLGVLFDLPEVVARAEAALEPAMRARIELRPGSFFEPLPAGHDAYLFKHILHDWDDDEARRILRGAREAFRQRAKLLVIEMVLPENGAAHVGKLVDLEMLLSVGGRERTRAQFAQLFASAGFRLQRVIATASPLCLLEAEPV